MSTTKTDAHHLTSGGAASAAGKHGRASDALAPPAKLQRQSTISAAGKAAAQDGKLWLLSTVDSGETRVPLQVVTQSSTLDHGSDKLDPAQPVPIPASTPLIVKMVDWMQHEWHRSTNPISATDQQAYIDSYFENVSTADDFVAVISVGDYLQIDSLVDAAVSVLFAAFAAEATHGAVERFRAKFGLIDDLGLLRDVLHAAKVGDVARAKAAVARGAVVSAAKNSKTGESALHVATAAGHAGMVEFLLGAGAGVNFVDNDGETALHVAATAGHADIVEFLLGAGAGVNSVDNDGETALYKALSEESKSQEVQRQEVVEQQLVLDAAALDQQIGSTEAQQTTHLVNLITRRPATQLSWVQLELCAEVCASLQKWAGEERTRRLAAIAARKGEKQAQWKGAMALYEAQLRETDKGEHSLLRLDQELWEAAVSGDLEAARQACDAGACFDLVHFGGDAIRRECMETMQEFFGIDGTIDETIEHRFIDYDEKHHFYTLLMVAVSSGNLDMVSWLLDLGCDVNSSQPNLIKGDGYGYGGRTPLMCAPSLSIVQELCARGADVKRSCCPPQYEERFSWIPTLVEVGGDEIARCVVKHGADVNLVSRCMPEGPDMGGTAELTSYWPGVVASGDAEYAAELLEKYGADPNWPHGLGEKYGDLGECDLDVLGLNGVFGPTVLMVAVERSDHRMVKLLLAAGADPNLPELVPEDHKVCTDGGAYGRGILLEVQKHYGLGDECVTTSAYDWETLHVPPTKKATPLSIALAVGDAMIVEALRAAGAVAHAQSSPTACRGQGWAY